MKNLNGDAKKQNDFICELCKNHFVTKHVTSIKACRSKIQDLILSKNPEINLDWYICNKDLDNYRAIYIENILSKSKWEISKIDQDVINGIKNQDILTENTDLEYDKNITFWERLSDGIAEFWWSWKFLISFMVFIIIWMIINIVILATNTFDPFPFILLNLILSCLASVQAPIIMMSQNRQETKDRLRSQNDYMVNLKAELEIRHINEKLDNLINQQWNSLLEIQEIQMELMEELRWKNRT